MSAYDMAVKSLSQRGELDSVKLEIVKMATELTDSAIMNGLIDMHDKPENKVKAIMECFDKIYDTIAFQVLGAKE